MPEVNAPTQQQPMEAPADSSIITQQPEVQAQPQMNSEEMTMRGGGCGESCSCCGVGESCFC
ncbi:hypothetical protein VPNG_01844 [Cytospora leucostoma]|uniref:Uncharacterized protein n=1 Tax=Cytospora leucostoma TaxID=1230097 RepID=A0A423XJ50_9PEZI|nr:hypothetical protein VPNG_01844 [Cytospora leucostoma]